MVNNQRFPAFPVFFTVALGNQNSSVPPTVSMFGERRCQTIAPVDGQRDHAGKGVVVAGLLLHERCAMVITRCGAGDRVRTMPS